MAKDLFNGSGVSDTDKFVDHDQYEQGGVVPEYTDNQNQVAPKGTLGPDQVLVKTVLKADGEQLKVQQNETADGVVVFAEPTLVDANGNVVGNTVRAEDCVDASRCAANGFVWVTENTGDGDTGSYGYCRELVAADFDGVTFTATADADCPVGSQFDGVTGCQPIDFVDFATPAGTKLENLSNDELMRECEGSGYIWDIYTNTCLDPSTPSNLDVALSSPAPSPLDHAKTLCRQAGLVWNPTLNAGVGGCEVDGSGGHATQAACEGNGYVWIAGTCYNPNDFGDGHSRLAKTATDPLAVPK